MNVPDIINILVKADEWILHLSTQEIAETLIKLSTENTPAGCAALSILAQMTGFLPIFINKQTQQKEEDSSDEEDDVKFASKEEQEFEEEVKKETPEEALTKHSLVQNLQQNLKSIIENLLKDQNKTIQSTIDNLELPVLGRH